MVETPNAASEAELIAAARLGSPQAFTELVKLHQAGVRLYLASFVRQLHAADDLAQEVFLAAYRSLAEYDEARPFEAWLLGIARHRALHHLRTEARRLQREGRRLDAALNGLRLHQADTNAEPDDQAKRELDALRACLRKVPAQGRELLDAFYARTEPACDIARRLGRTASAVRMTLLRIRRALADCIRRKLAEGEM